MPLLLLMLAAVHGAPAGQAMPSGEQGASKVITSVRRPSPLILTTVPVCGDTALASDFEPQDEASFVAANPHAAGRRFHTAFTLRESAHRAAGPPPPLRHVVLLC